MIKNGHPLATELAELRVKYRSLELALDSTSRKRQEGELLIHVLNWLRKLPDEKRAYASRYLRKVLEDLSKHLGVK